MDEFICLFAPFPFLPQGKKKLAVALKPGSQTDRLAAKSGKVPSAFGKTGPTKVQRADC